jgi:hypothetical protein
MIKPNHLTVHLVCVLDTTLNKDTVTNTSTLPNSKLTQPGTPNKRQSRDNTKPLLLDTPQQHHLLHPLTISNTISTMLSLRIPMVMQVLLQLVNLCNGAPFLLVLKLV